MLEKHFVKQALNKLKLDTYLTKELDRAGFTKSEIVKTPLVTRIVVNVTRPGLAIGKSGANIQQLTETIEKRFGIDNPQIEIKEIEKPELDAKAVANKIKALVERGFSWRSVVFKAVQEIQASGAQGLEIILSGKITGKAGRKRSQRIAHGYMKKVGEQAKLVDYGQAAAYPKVGAIGIKVKIVRPETVFPDKEKMKDYIKAKEEGRASEAKKEAVVETVVEEKVEVKEETVPETKVETKTEAAKIVNKEKGEKPKHEKKEIKKEETKHVEKKEAHVEKVKQESEE
ncbi:MAG TPA: 30S ribosomal protein S3 [archaeon]|nr:30S ribosomal protein S3 [archaeon]